MNSVFLIGLINVVYCQQYQSRSYNCYSPEYYCQIVTARDSNRVSKTSIWIDADPSLRDVDVDDSLAILVAFLSYEIDVVGISIVFGNSEMEQCFERAQFLMNSFDKLKFRQIPVLRGTRSASEVGIESEATTGLAKALSQQTLVVVALGPLTNIASMLYLHPNLVSRISSLIIVAGRRPGQVFRVGNNGQFGDMNFDKDPYSMKIVIESNVNVIMTPWEVSSTFWIKQADLAEMKSAVDACLLNIHHDVLPDQFVYCSHFSVLLDHMFQWSNHWARSFGTDGFNPFDCLAVGYLLDPDIFLCEDLYPSIILPKSLYRNADSDIPKLLLLENKMSTQSIAALSKTLEEISSLQEDILITTETYEEKGALILDKTFATKNSKQHYNNATKNTKKGTVKYCFDIDEGIFHQRIMDLLPFPRLYFKTM